MALDKHPELREAVHKLLGPRLPEGVWVSNHIMAPSGRPAPSSPDLGTIREGYTVKVEFGVWDGAHLETLIRLIHRYSTSGGDL